MKIIKKVLLTILAMLPVASISTVAYSQLNELAGEGQTDLLRFKISQARQLLFPNGVLITTFDEARERLARETGITDDRILDEEFNKQLQILLDNGLIDTNEVQMVSKSPSAW